MFFEGAEKKVEIIVRPTTGTLLDIPKEYWQILVKKCQATILSEIKNDKLIAFLLSESSLFVWEDRILMLTCGQTVLINSVIEFIQKFGINEIETLVYQRKNECFSRLQPTSFNEDLKTIKEKIPGKAYRFGKAHGHYNQLFHSETNFKASPDDKTIEHLMYDLDDLVIKSFISDKMNNIEIRNFLKLDEILKDYMIDDFVFDPYGYSLNAIKDGNYLTIHITPQPKSSYASLEFSETERSEEIINHFLKIFGPKSFDTMSFNTELNLNNELFTKIEHRKTTIDNGYAVDFGSYFTACNEAKAPEEIL